MSNDFPSLDILRDLVADRIGIEPSEVLLQRCTTGKHNQSYLADAADQSLVLGIAPPDDRTQMLFYEYRMMRQEPDLHEVWDHHCRSRTR